MQIFDAEMGYIPHEVHRPHPLDPLFEHCNILGIDWIRLNRVVLNFKQNDAQYADGRVTPGSWQDRIWG